ncbi:hypothetical protein HYH02_005547 [Chlamydomonas schloesseri]|uniref:Rab-GAP TBC domain-containing protein n=1 Tax=Chlamydomonas schloesseri TaxID=2026947 RepID=A0A835WKS0_9CHLO|nr:hypothetical protein HYH02_005547 [Chlamydomonas schloesseri]|eukprot:KAG2449397.1 hypothetical protein HYH02_005547 [Chlamydomonas schloesseri]
MATAQPAQPTDIYGFRLEQAGPQQLADLQRQRALYALQEKAWKKYTDKQPPRLPSGNTLKRLVREGVPPQLRGWVWMETSGAGEMRAAHTPSYYGNLVRAQTLSKATAQVELDLPRTFPGHPYLSAEEGRAAMRRILTAYSVHNPVVGYCQGINFTVGVVLVAVGRDEEAAFWLLAALVERICFPGSFGQTLSGCHVEMRTLQELVGEKLPRLHAHMARLGCDTSLIATDWFLTLYCSSMPPESACRVLDALFHEGAKILFRVALALLKSAEAALLRTDNAGDFMRVVKDWVSHLYNIDQVMQVAFDGIGSLSMHTLDAVRKVKDAEVKDFMRQRAQQRAQNRSSGPAQEGPRPNT